VEQMRDRMVGVFAGIVLLFVLIWSPPGSIGADAGAISGGKEAIITIEGTTVTYRGPITEENTQLFLDLVKGKNLKTLMITSGGGDINTGMDMGRWIFKNEIDVVVEGMCMSSCANYIFTAGKKKIIRPGAIVAWHGNALQNGGDWEKSFLRSIQEAINGLPPEERDKVDIAKAMEGAMEYIKECKRKQAAFFQEIGVDEYVCRVGSEESGARDFFILSVEDMERFGIREIQAPDMYYNTDLSRFNREKPQSPVEYIKIGPTNRNREVGCTKLD